MNKKQLRKKCLEIIDMNKGELISFAGQLSLSDLEDKPRRFLQKALDLRLMELRGVVSPEAVCCDFKEVDLWWKILIMVL